MAGPLLIDRVKETTTTTGTGTVNLAGAVTGFQSFVSGVGTTNTCFYCIEHQTQNEWEIGIGTVTDASPDTLSRTTILGGTNGTSAVNFSAGTKNVFCIAPGTYGFPYIRDASTFAIYASNQTLGSTTAGNARGNNSIDLQLVRDNANRVASGFCSVITGGQSNRVAGDNSIVCGGESNWITQANVNYQSIVGGIGNQITTTGGSNTIVGGATNTISAGGVGFIGGGESNTLSSSDLYNSIVGGFTNTISGGEHCTIGGGANNTIQSGQSSGILYGATNVVNESYAAAYGLDAKSEWHGAIAHAAGKLSAVGDAQTFTAILRGTTTNNTSTEIFLDGSSKKLVLPNDTTWFFDLLCVGRRADVDNGSAAISIQGCIDRNTNAASTAIVGTNNTMTVIRDNASYGVSAVADTTNGSLKISVVGVSGHTINWVVIVRIIQVTG